MPQLFHQNVSFYGLTFSVFLVKGEGGKQVLVASEAPGRVFQWFYLHVVYDCLDRRRKLLSELAEVAGLIGYAFGNVEGGRLDYDEKILELMRRIVRRMRADHTWFAKQALHSAQALDYWVHRPDPEHTSKHEMFTTQLYDSEIDAILGLKTRFYREPVNYARDPEEVVIASRSRLQPLLPREHIPIWEDLVRKGRARRSGTTAAIDDV